MSCFSSLWWSWSRKYVYHMLLPLWWKSFHCSWYETKIWRKYCWRHDDTIQICKNQFIFTHLQLIMSYVMQKSLCFETMNFQKDFLIQKVIWSWERTWKNSELRQKLFVIMVRWFSDATLMILFEKLDTVHYPNHSLSIEIDLSDIRWWTEDEKPGEIDFWTIHQDLEPNSNSWRSDFAHDWKTHE